MSDFCHLHVHSYYSLMDGLNSPGELLDAAKDLGQNHLSITDHGTLSAHRVMLEESKARGMTPILGLEAYISPTDRFDRRSVKKRDDNTQAYNHIILLAKDADGYRNLNRLSEIAWTEGFYSKPRIDREVLAEYRDGLIVLSGCMNGLIAKAIEREDWVEARVLTRWFKNTFEDNFYMEVQPHNPFSLNSELLKLSYEFGIKPVATGDCHFARAEDKAVEEALLILATSPKIGKGASYAEGKKKRDIFERLNYLYPDRKMSFEEIDLYVHGRADIQSSFEKAGFDRADIYENTMEIAEKIGEYEYNQGLDLLPKPKGEDPHAILERKAWAGLKWRGLSDSQIHKDRLREELDIIKDKNFSPYFLIEANAVQWSRSKGIRVGPGRGSGAGSLLNYALGVTAVDPIKFNLLFFRFINPERNDYPDIDTDFEDRRRGEVKDYMRRQYKHVASIATYGYFKDKGVIRDAARVFMVPLGDVNRALKNVNTFEEFETSENTKEFRQKYPEVIDLAKKLRGSIRSQGMHAGGLVVSSKPINEIAPMQTVADTQDKSAPRIPLVALDMNEAADLGLIKYDFLGVKALSVVSDTVKLIEERHGVKLDLENMELDDPKVFRTLSDGYTKGVFQCEATPYTNLLIRMGGVSNFEELVASNALVRPGAADSTAGADFIARKNGRAIPQYHHPDMQWFTEETYGTIIYQEQVMLTMTELAGMPMSTADKVRKIIGKKRDVSEFEQYKNEFIEGASKKVSPLVAEGLWHDFEAHANYSFNKSHAVAYSMISYWTAWLKEYYPVEFITSILKNEKDKDTRLEYLIEAKRLALRVKLPHVNESDLEFSIQSDDKGDYIRFGLSNVKYISDKVGNRILEYRPFRDYAELRAKVEEKGSGLTSTTLKALNAIGGAVFPDNPRRGNERENLYEYLAIPAFDTKNLSPKIKAQFKTLDEFDPDTAFVTMGMVKKIATGPGWARVEVVDETGTAGIFTEPVTPIEAGKMYVFLVAKNRIARYITVDELVNDEGGEFQEFLEALEFPDVPDGMQRVVSFKSRKTKAGKNMANAVFSDGQKNLTAAMVFPQQFYKAYTVCKDGAVLDVQFGQTDDGSVFVSNIL